MEAGPSHNLTVINFLKPTLTDSDGTQVDLDVSAEDISEEKLIDKFFTEGCGCTLGPKASQAHRCLPETLLHELGKRV